MSKVKGLGIFSGGLDSLLAAMHLKRMGHPVEVVNFQTPFFNSQRARRSARAAGLDLLVRDVGPAHLELVKNPPHGYGSQMNPCVDCHAFMLRRAGEMLPERGAAFIFSGEVLGQRPMSQNYQALKTVAKASGYDGLILRPLSAKLLPPSEVERQGLVERGELLDIQGRTRRRQMELARRYGISDYPSPAGGCSLTEPGFSRRLRDLLDHRREATLSEVELLRAGRHFRLSPRAKLVLGRNQADNQALEQLAPPGCLRLLATEVAGPLGLVCGNPGPSDLRLAAGILAGYLKAPPGEPVAVAVDQGEVLTVEPLSRRRAHEMLV